MGRPAYTLESYIVKANQVHNNKYDYSKTVYTKSKHHITVICPDHGEFKTRADGHINLPSGCPTCGRIKSDLNRRLTTEEYIKRASELHNNFYDYSKTIYTHNKNKVIITCPVHGDFEINAYSHIKTRSLSGCPKCNSSGYSRKCIQWLEEISQQESIFIQHAENIGEYKIPGTKFKADGFCAETNTVYEYYGDKWHGNIFVYGATTKCHPFSKKTAEELYQQTLARENIIKELGYNVVSRWEST